MNELTGKVALVTGGARRLGRAMSLEFARRGANVAITFLRSEGDAKQFVADAQQFGTKALAVRCDVTDESSVRSMIASVKSEFGGLDLLVNNAALYESVPFEQITTEQWDRMFATNARSPYVVTRAALDLLRARKGRVINMGSLGGALPWTTHGHYCSSKAAVHMLTEVMAKALAPEISVNCVAPGMIELEPDSQSVRHVQFMERMAGKAPMQRNGTAEDVVAAAMFFATAPQFITGQIVFVDGGLRLS